MCANRAVTAGLVAMGWALTACLDLDVLQGLAGPQDAAPDLLRLNDLGGGSGCRVGGIPLGAGWACPGLYNATSGDAVPSAAELCAMGFSVCTSAAGLSLSMCDMQPGFFVAAVPLHHPRMSTAALDLACGLGMGSDAPMFAGCGAGQPTEALFSPAAACAGFLQAIDCALSSSLVCGMAADLSTAAQYSPSSGVLCCPR